MSNLPTASFPSSVWDTLTDQRVSDNTYAAFEAGGTLELLSEIVALETSLVALAADLVIWVSPTGVAATATGSLTNPFPTLALAFEAITATKTNIMLMPGTYTLTAVQALPIAQDDVKIIGVGGSKLVVIAGGDADYALGLAPAAQGAAFTITVQGVTINQYAAKKGLYIDDTSIDGAVTINLTDVVFVQDTSGVPID